MKPHTSARALCMFACTGAASGCLANGVVADAPVLPWNPSSELAQAISAVAVLLLLAVLWLLRESRRLRRGRERLRRDLETATTQLDDLRVCDPLTGLVPREELEQALTQMGRAGDGAQAVTVMLVALDNLGELNQAYGLAAGDQALVAVAGRLSRLVGERPHVSRTGGHEFALLWPGSATDAIAAAGRILQLVQQPVRLAVVAETTKAADASAAAGGSADIVLSASIGLASYPDHGALPRLLGHAALALASAKQAGGGAFAVFDAAMAVNHREQLELLRDLRQALARDEMQLVYQPKVDAASLQVTAAEALLRWHHPVRGVVSPEVFIPLAERHGLISAIGGWVIEEACRQAAAWRQQGLRMRVAINISNQQMRGDELLPQLEQAIQRHGLRAERLTCEVTETLALDDTPRTRAAFERLRQLGVHVSIDDFGTGQSSLALLRRLPAAELKVDRAFVADLATSAEARGIVKAVVQMAQTLGLRVVAEGVETEAQRDLLVALGVNELQGYLFARAMSATALGLWAAEDDRANAPAAFRASLFNDTDAAPLSN
jgi:diguanylate cyclase (GGDEF)-like protein